jgi:hypothetical protein
VTAKVAAAAPTGRCSMGQHRLDEGTAPGGDPSPWSIGVARSPTFHRGDLGPVAADLGVTPTDSAVSAPSEGRSRLAHGRLAMTSTAVDHVNTGPVSAPKTGPRGSPGEERISTGRLAG